MNPDEARIAIDRAQLRLACLELVRPGFTLLEAGAARAAPRQMLTPPQAKAMVAAASILAAFVLKPTQESS